MGRSTFVDTSGWYALIDRNDAAHHKASELVRHLVGEGTRLVTTDYVIDEACTLAKARAGAAAAARLLDLLDQTAALEVEWIGPDRFDAAKRTFCKHQDQAFSFTDCTSFTVMRERRVTDTITSDDHFRIAGFHPLLASRSKAT